MLVKILSLCGCSSAGGSASLAGEEEKGPDEPDRASKPNLRPFDHHAASRLNPLNAPRHNEDLITLI